MGDNNFRVGIFLNKNLLGQGYRKQITFFRPYGCNLSILFSPNSLPKYLIIANFGHPVSLSCQDLEHSPFSNDLRMMEEGNMFGTHA